VDSSYAGLFNPTGKAEKSSDRVSEKYNSWLVLKIIAPIFLLDREGRLELSKFNSKLIFKNSSSSNLPDRNKGIAQLLIGKIQLLVDI
jgi:hypothetical protein